MYGQGFYVAKPLTGMEIAAGAFDALTGSSTTAVTVQPADLSLATVFRAPLGGFTRREPALEGGRG